MSKKIGVVGTGRLGGMLIKGMIKQVGIFPDQIIIYNRTIQKLHDFKKNFNNIVLAQSAAEVFLNSEWIFLCIKPVDLPTLLEQIDTEILQNKVVISTLVVPELKELDKLLKGKVVRVYPSITQSTGHGVTLIAFGEKVTMNDKQEIISFFNLLGKTYEVPEEHFRYYGDITSCGPAFMAYMIGTLAELAAEKNLDNDIAEEMALETMLGTAIMLGEEKLSFKGLVKEVAAPGGTTEEGIRVLEKGIPPIFRELFDATKLKQQTSLNNVITKLRQVGL